MSQYIDWGVSTIQYTSINSTIYNSYSATWTIDPSSNLFYLKYSDQKQVTGISASSVFKNSTSGSTISWATNSNFNISTSSNKSS